MYLLYVDESGDIGLQGTPGSHFALSGFVVHELRWATTLEAVVHFRKHLRAKYGLKLREELHAGHLINKPGALRRIQKWRRLEMLKETLDFEAGLPDVSVINVVVDKRTKAAGYDVFENAWRTLIQRFHNTISNRNFPGPQNAQDLGLLIVDQTDEVKLRALLRRMRHYNPVPNTGGGGYRQILLDTMVEDPVHRDSRHSNFVQLADVNAYFLYQKVQPSSFVKRQGARNYLDRLDPILCKVCSRTDLQGIVRL